MAYNSSSLPHFTVLIILLFFCGVALSDKEILLQKSQVGWYINGGPVAGSHYLGSWFVSHNNIYVVCDTFTTVEPTNWLRTHFIDVKDALRVDIAVKYSIRKCRPGRRHCKENFKLYVHHTTRLSPRPNPFATQFDFVTKAKPTNVPDRVTLPSDYNLLNVSIKPKSEGIYLGFYDQGACLDLLSVQVSFNYCPERNKNLVIFGRTVSPFSNSNVTQVQGKCSDGHSRNTTVLTAGCTSQGVWRINDNVRCLCQQGYKYSEKPRPHCRAARGS